MEKSLIVRFRVEDMDIPDLLKSLFLLEGADHETDACLAVIEDFYILTSRTCFDDLGLPPVKK